MAAPRRHRQDDLAIVDQQPMIAGHADRRHAQASPHRRELDVLRAACFEAQSRVTGFVRADVKPYRPARRRRDQRRQRLHGGPVLQQPAAGQQIAARGTRQAKRLEHVAQHLGRDSPLPSGDVVPLDRDTGAVREVPDRFVTHRPTEAHR